MWFARAGALGESVVELKIECAVYEMRISLCGCVILSSVLVFSCVWSVCLRRICSSCSSSVKRERGVCVVSVMSVMLSVFILCLVFLLRA